MTQTAIRIHTRVLPGKRVEFTAPELPDEGDVELFVVLPPSEASEVADGGYPRGVMDFLQSLPVVQRTPEEWAAVEREVEKERSTWDR